MSVQKTIQDLYSDIADIKEYICQTEDYPIADGLEEIGYPFDYIFPSKTEAITLWSESTFFLSRVLDASDNNYDEFIGNGFGSISSLVDVEGTRFVTEPVIINRRRLIYYPSRFSVGVHVRPSLDCYIQLKRLIFL